MWNWKVKGEEKLLPSLEDFEWKGRRVNIVTDSDGLTNEQVREAADRLAALLADEGALVYLHILPELKEGEKTGLDDFLVARSPAAYRELLAKAEPWQAPDAISRGDRLDVAVDKAERILAGTANLKLFTRGERLVRVVEEESGKHKETAVFHRPPGNIYMAELSAESIQYLIAKVGCFFTKTKDGKRKADTPPFSICRQVIARVATFPDQVPWQHLDLVTSSPLLLANGDLVEEPGYHASSRVWFDPCGLKFPPIPRRPTKAEARTALREFDKVFSRFPFEIANKEAWHQSPSYAAVLATILSILLRHLVPTVPLLGITAPQAGTGKTKIAEAIAELTTGRMPARITYDNMEEFEKHVTIPVTAGDRIILIDNIERSRVKSPRLCTMLTTDAPTRFRVLGETRDRATLNRSVFIATGNQLAISGELPRRSLLVKLLPDDPHPESRHFDFEPVGRAHELFPRLAVAALTAARYYLQAGAPQPKYQDVPWDAGNFEAWNRFVRGLLIHLDFGDPLLTQHDVQAEDPAQQDETALLAALYRTFADKIFTVASIRSLRGTDIHGMFQDRYNGFDPQFAGVRLRALRDRILEVPTTDDGEKTIRLQLRPAKARHNVARYQVAKK